MAAHPPPPPGAERRVHPRKDVFAQVEILRDEGVMIVAVLNVSLGGAFFELSEPGLIVPGDRVKVHLTSGERDAVQPAKVVRLVDGPPRGFAVAGQDRTPETLAVLSLLMR